MRPPGSAAAYLWEVLAGPAARITGRAARVNAKKRVTLPPPHIDRQAHGARAPFSDNLISFVDSVAGGVFRCIQRPAGSFTTVSSASRIRLSPLRRLNALPGSLRTRATKAFGPTPRSVPFVPRTASVGLGVARNFSSSRPVFQNIVNNAPLGLRALCDTDGLDDRKWRRAVRVTRRQQRTAVKGQGRLTSRDLTSKSKAEEFAYYFSTPAALETQVTHAPAASSSKAPITLVIPLEPELGHLLSASNLATPCPDSYRLLTLDVLRALDFVTAAYEAQANKIRALTNSLSRAGVDEDANVRMEASFGPDGVKDVHILFGGRWTKADVQQATGDWDREGWYRIIDPSDDDSELEDLLPRSMATSTCSTADVLACSTGSSTASESLYAFSSEDLDLRAHDLVASSYRFPTVLDSVDSPEASHWSECSDSPDHTTTFSDEDVVDGEDGDPAREWSTVMTESQIQYFEGVRDHLGDLDMFERERAFLRPPLSLTLS